MAKDKKSSKAGKKTNPLQAARTAANKLKRAARQRKLPTKGLGIPRGTARKERRISWERVRKPIEVTRVREIYDALETKKQGKIVFSKVTEKVKSWKPTFAEFTRQQDTGGYRDGRVA